MNRLSFEQASSAPEVQPEQTLEPHTGDSDTFWENFDSMFDFSQLEGNDAALAPQTNSGELNGAREADPYHTLEPTTGDFDKLWENFDAMLPQPEANEAMLPPQTELDQSVAPTDGNFFDFDGFTGSFFPPETYLNGGAELGDLGSQPLGDMFGSLPGDELSHPPAHFSAPNAMLQQPAGTAIGDSKTNSASQRR